MKASLRDHDHFNGKFRGAAHSKCNIKLQVDRKNVKIPVFFHNFAGYDSHIVVNGLEKKDCLEKRGGKEPKSLENL